MLETSTVPCYSVVSKVSCLVVSNSLPPHGLQPTRLLCPWNSRGKNTGVGCHSLLQQSLKLDFKRGYSEHYILIDKVGSQRYGLTILKPPYVYIRIKQVNRWQMKRFRLSLLEQEITHKQGEKARIIHMLMDQRFRHQYELMFS